MIPLFLVRAFSRALLDPSRLAKLLILRYNRSYKKSGVEEGEIKREDIKHKLSDGDIREYVFMQTLISIREYKHN